MCKCEPQWVSHQPEPMYGEHWYNDIWDARLFSLLDVAAKAEIPVDGNNGTYQSQGENEYQGGRHYC